MKPQETNKFIVLSGLSLFTKQAENLPDLDTYLFLNDYYKIIKTHISIENGKIIKYMGDSCLISFEPNKTESIILCLNNLKNKLDSWLPTTKFKSSKSDIRCHIGNVIEANFDNSNKIDIIGKSVNYLFKMRGNGLVTSDDINSILSSI